jgi:hypothetical protein
MQAVEQLKTLPMQVATIIDVQCLGETLGRKLWPNEYQDVIDYLFANDASARAIAKEAADTTFEIKLQAMEEEHEYHSQFVDC